MKNCNEVLAFEGEEPVIAPNMIETLEGEGYRYRYARFPEGYRTPPGRVVVALLWNRIPKMRPAYYGRPAAERRSPPLRPEYLFVEVDAARANQIKDKYQATSGFTEWDVVEALDSLE